MFYVDLASENANATTLLVVVQFRALELRTPMTHFYRLEPYLGLPKLTLSGWLVIFSGHT